MISPLKMLLAQWGLPSTFVSLVAKSSLINYYQYWRHYQYGYYSESSLVFFTITVIIVAQIGLSPQF
jgi:hypothetical protein